jgi:hypothetical protein
MSTDEIKARIAAALSAKGSGALTRRELVELIEIGCARGLAVSTVDATSENGWAPRPDVGFHVTWKVLDRLRETPDRRANLTSDRALRFYRHLPDEEGVEFEVWFWRD